MLVLNKQVMLSVDTQLDQPESRRVTFYTGRNNIFYLELAIDRTEFIKLHDFEVNETLNPDEVIAQAEAERNVGHSEHESQDTSEQDELLKSLGM
jgi:hypothetical protein